MDSLKAVFEIALEVNESHTNADAMQEECRRIGKLVGGLIPILETFVTELVDGSANGGSADVIECQGPFLKKPKHRVGVTSEKWDERYFRLYSNRLVYGKLNKEQFTPRSKPFVVNHLTEVGEKPSSPKKASASGKGGNNDALVLSLSFQESAKDKVEKEFFKFEDVAKGNEFRAKLLRIVECSRPDEEGHPSGGVSVVDRRWIENLEVAMRGAQETIAACTTSPIEVQIMPSTYASKLLAANEAIEGAIKGAALMAGVTAAAERALASLGSDFQDLRDAIDDTLCASQSLSRRKQLEDLVAAFEEDDEGAQRSLAEELEFSGGVDGLKRSLADIDPVQLGERRGAEAPKGSRERFEFGFLKRIWAAATGRGAEASALSDSDSGSDYGSYSLRKLRAGSRAAAVGSEGGSHSEEDDENADLMGDFDKNKVELSGTFKKKKHHKKVWSERTFRLYVDRLEYGIEINGEFKEKDHSPIKLTKRSTLSPESDTSMVAQFPLQGAFKTRVETFSWDSEADAANFKKHFEEIIDRHKMQAEFPAGGNGRESMHHLDGINLFKTRKEDKKRIENPVRYGTFCKLGKTSYQWQKRHYYLSRESLEYGSEHEQEDGWGAPTFFFVPGSQSPFPISSKLVILDKQDEKTACIRFTDESTSKSYEEKFLFEDGSIDEFLAKLQEQVNGHKRKDREVKVLKEYTHYLQRIEKEPNYRSSEMRELLDALKKSLKQFRVVLDDTVASSQSHEAHGGYYFDKHDLLETIKESKEVIKENASAKDACSFGLENVQKSAIVVANELFKMDLTREVEKPLESPGGSLSADMAREDADIEVFAQDYSSSFQPPEILSDSLERENIGIRNLISLAGDGGDAQLLVLAERRLSVIAAIRADELQGLREAAQVIDVDANPGELEYCEARAKVIERKLRRWEEEGQRKMRQVRDPQQCDRMFVESVLATAEEGATIHGEKVSWADQNLLAEARRRAKELREQEEDPEEIVQAWVASRGAGTLDAAMEMWTAQGKKSASLNPPPIMLWLRFTCLCHQQELVHLRLVIKRAIEKVSKKGKPQEPEHMLHFLHMLQTPKLMYDTVGRMQKELPLAQKWRFTDALSKLDPAFFNTDEWRKVFFSPRRFKGTAGGTSIAALPSTVSAWMEITLGPGLGEEKLQAALSVAEEAGVRDLEDLMRLKRDPWIESGGEGGRVFYERMTTGNVAVVADGAPSAAAAEAANVEDFDLLIAVHAVTSSFFDDADVF